MNPENKQSLIKILILAALILFSALFGWLVAFDYFQPRTADRFIEVCNYLYGETNWQVSKTPGGKWTCDFKQNRTEPVRELNITEMPTRFYYNVVE